MPDFDVFSLLEIRKRKRRSHGKRQKGNDKRKRCVSQKSGTSLINLSSKSREHGRHAMLSFLSSLPIPVLRILVIEANRFYINFGLVRMYVTPYRFSWTIFILCLALSYTDKLLVFRWV